MMISALRAVIFVLAVASAALAFEGAKMELGPEAVERGRALYARYCLACHGLKYYRGPDATAGMEPAMDPASAEAAFGVAPPDLSLMASARGRGDDGAKYIYDLLTTYYTSEDGQVRNRAFAEETASDGAIAMSPPIPVDDPELSGKAADISAFLLEVSDPSRHERAAFGPWVMAYMVILTAVLYALNRLTWKGVKKRLGKR